MYLRTVLFWIGWRPRNRRGRLLATWLARSTTFKRFY